MNIIKSIGSFIRQCASFVWAVLKKIGVAASWYKGLWVKLTHNKYDEFVYKRGALMAVGTLLSMFVIVWLFSFIFQVGYYFATYKKETLYLYQSEEIYPDDNIWGVRGCHTPNCDSSSSVYYRIKPSIFHHLWSINDNGHIFLPDALGSSVPTGLTRCEVVSYGMRFRFLMLFHVYPNILKISCSLGPRE